MKSDRFHPPGLIIRTGRHDASRFARIDTAGREIALGSDWQVAYRGWLEARMATTVVPRPTPVAWLISEFGERHRPAEKRARRVFGNEIQQLAQLMQAVNNPLVEELSAADCLQMRALSSAGPVKTESLIRRLRQIWRWASREGLTDRECPCTAQTQESAVRSEIIDLVGRHLPKNVLLRIAELRVSSQECAHTEMALSLRSLAAAVRRAARLASLQVERDGRPDLIGALRRCELAWFLEARQARPAEDRGGAELLLGHSRCARVRDLRQQARNKSKSSSAR